MNISDKLFDLQPAQGKGYSFDPRLQLLGLILSCLTALFLKTVPVLYLYLFIPLGIIGYINLDFLSFKGIQSILFLSLLACGCLYWWGKSQIPSNLEAMATARAILRVFIFVACGLLFVFATSLPRFIHSLEKMRVPFSLIFVVTMAIRFFPLMIREMEYINDNAKNKGLGKGRWILHPCQSGRAFFFPLVIRSLKKADALAMAATTRGFGAPIPRTSIHKLKISTQDFLFLLSLLILLLFLLLLDRWILLRWV